MAPGGRGESGQRTLRPCSPRPGKRSGEGHVPGEAPIALSAPPKRPRATRTSSSLSRLAAGRGQGPVVSATAEDPAPPTHPPFLSPQPAHAPQAQKKRRRKRAHLEPSRGAAGAEARGAAASPADAAGRGVAEKAPFSGAARACSPAAPQPLSACRPPPPQIPAPRLDARSLGFPLRHRRARRGAAGPSLCGRGEAGARTPARRRRGARESGLGAE